MTSQTLETIEKTVLQYCQQHGYQFKKHDGTPPFYTVIERGFRVFYDGNELAGYMDEILSRTLIPRLPE